MERATGIEPAWPAWKAGALPLSYARRARAAMLPQILARTAYRTGLSRKWAPEVHTRVASRLRDPALTQRKDQA